MDDTRQRVRDAGRRTAPPGFGLDDVRARKERRERGRRLRAGVVGATIAAGLVVGGITLLGPSGRDTAPTLDGGQGLPAAERPPRALAAGEYSYQRIWIYETCGEPDMSPGSGCASPQLHLESWWAPDDSGRREVIEKHAYGLHDTGRFGPGEFPDEGDLSAFPTDPDALEAFLLDRSAPKGASPRPEVTPAPGVPIEQGWIWNSVQDYMAATQYLNATPELRAAMLRVLAEQPMVEVQEVGTDPLGRSAIVLSFFAYGADQRVFVDPLTGDFLAMTGRYVDDVRDVTHVRLVEEAGFTSSDDERPRGDDRTVVPA